MTRNYSVFIIVAALMLACSKGDSSKTPAASATAGGSVGVKILMPVDRSKINADSVTVTYEVKPSPNGDHIHVYVDDRKPDVLRKLKGDYDIAGLTPGEHTVAIKEVNAGHTPTGHDAVVHFTVEK